MPGQAKWRTLMDDLGVSPAILLTLGACWCHTVQLERVPCAILRCFIDEYSGCQEDFISKSGLRIWTENKLVPSASRWFLEHLWAPGRACKRQLNFGTLLTQTSGSARGTSVKAEVWGWCCPHFLSVQHFAQTLICALLLGAPRHLSKISSYVLYMPLKVRKPRLRENGRTLPTSRFFWCRVLLYSLGYGKWL